jgi:hypothetical protein
MDDRQDNEVGTQGPANADVRLAIREAIEEFSRREAQKTEPAYKNELIEERRRREQLERRVNELINENARSRQIAEEAERNAAIRTELQRLGVGKVDLAFKAVKDDIRRSEEGHLVAVGEQGTMGVREYLTQFVGENPEFLPARKLGGAGTAPGPRTSTAGNPGIELEKIKPGMAAEELDRVRQEVARLAAQSFNGQ